MSRTDDIALKEFEPCFRDPRAGRPKASETLVFVVDDDASMRNALNNLLRSVGFEAQLFASANEFLQCERRDVTSCLILDVRLPGISGLELQRDLAAADVRLPIIFVTAHGDLAESARALKAGAVEFLTKPFRDQDLLDALEMALAQDRARRESASSSDEVLKRFLSPDT